MRGDLADIRLAEYVFAPHYAAPLAMAVLRPIALRAGPEPEAGILCMLDSGDVFEALEFSGKSAWGTAARQKLVGYVDLDALALAPAAEQAAK